MSGQARCNYGCTPMHYAVQGGSVQCLLLLMFAGATVDAEDHDSCTPLHHAVYRAAPLPVLEVLLQGGADPNMRCTKCHGRTALQAACAAGSEEQVGLLVAYGGSVRFRDANGDTALHIAARRGYTGVCRQILDYDLFTLHFPGQFDVLPVVLAALSGSTECSALLCSVYANYRKYFTAVIEYEFIASSEDEA